MTIVLFLRNAKSDNLIIESIEMLLVRLHIRRQDHADHSLTEEDSLIMIEVLHEVILWLLHQTDSNCSMPIFLYCLIMIAHRPLSARIHVVRVVKSIMFHIVAHRGDD